jgi:dipeptidyl aminopeptidase/acylaminoacyl peptidase
MRSTARRLLAASLLLCLPALAQDTITPPAALVMQNVPPIPAELAQKLHPYNEFRPHGFHSWHPTKREMLVSRRLTATSQVHRVPSPGAPPEPLTDLPDAVAGASFQPATGSYFVFARAEGGNEVYRYHRFDLDSKSITPFSPEGERADNGAWNRAGDRFVYTTTAIDRNSSDRVARMAVHVVDPAKPESDRIVARLQGGGWGDFHFSEDGRQLVYIEFKSVNESHVWVMDAASGKARRISRAGGKDPVSYAEARFSLDGKSIFATSDRDGEFRRIVVMPVAGGAERVLTPHLAYDVEILEPSFDAKRMAFVTNENGSSVLRFLDLDTLKEVPRPPLVQGVISRIEWRRGSSELAFTIRSARSAGDVFSYDVKTNQTARWTNGNSPEIATSDFVEPRLIKWKSFDGLQVTGFHYHPPAKFTGKRPVIINIHGGPEAQARPGFIGRNNYFVNELGIAILYPNVRGSTGFGKSFVKLDNGRKREDSVKDIGALIEWIRTQPDLDADRLMVMGGSYGGYMALACAVHYDAQLAGTIDVVGISNFVTFLERTETYRRDLRRVEYGDERDPAMRAFLESISPLAHVERITKPLFVVQGRNDPRVPYTEAEQIVASLKERDKPVWFMLANDEGHGFAKKPNADYLFYATVEFARRTLLR